ncbi:hypothetical protein ACJJTC_010608 [Scirpophaga incertulas]
MCSLLILANGHTCGGELSSLLRTRSFIIRFGIGCRHLLRFCNEFKYMANFALHEFQTVTEHEKILEDDINLRFEEISVERSAYVEATHFRGYYPLQFMILNQKTESLIAFTKITVTTPSAAPSASNSRAPSPTRTTSASRTPSATRTPSAAPSATLLASFLANPRTLFYPRTHRGPARTHHSLDDPRVITHTLQPIALAIKITNGLLAPPLPQPATTLPSTYQTPRTPASRSR